MLYRNFFLLSLRSKRALKLRYVYYQGQKCFAIGIKATNYIGD